MDAQLLRMIHDLGFSGGFVFEWADEWFKFTWNTIDYELPAERRALWVDPWTNEEHFGLLSTDPGAVEVALIDGDGSEWTTNGSQVIYEGSKGLREVRAVKDEGYLYLRLVLDDPAVWKNEAVGVGLDVIPGGNGGLPGLPGKDPEADYAVVLGPGPKGEAYTEASNDRSSILWGKIKGYVPFDQAASAADSGVWYPEQLIINRPLVIPATGQKLPAEFFDVGQMRYGSSDPTSTDFDCRATWKAGDCIEVRLPYETIGFSDPSSLQALVVNPDGALTTKTVARVGIAIAVGSEVFRTNGYAWDPWQRVSWHERLKAGIEQYERALLDVTIR
jgi:hypothetical protein